MTAQQITVNVLAQRHDYDCTKGGVTSRADRFTLYANDEAFAADPRADPLKALIVVRRRITGMGEYVHCIPAIAGDGCGPMAGGNFVYTCDSRYREVTGVSYPISVHDRFE